MAGFPRPQFSWLLARGVWLLHEAEAFVNLSDLFAGHGNLLEALIIGPESDPSFDLGQLALPNYVEATGDIGRGDRI